MNVIYCGKPNKIPFYIKEADMNIYSIQELAYFIFNYAMLLSNGFISKSLIIYIDNVLKIHKLASELNEMFNKKSNLADMLILILSNSNYYDEQEIVKFKNRLLRLLEMSENEYINLAGDKLFYLKKYEKAIAQYNKISKTDENAVLKLAYCYAKLQFYETATNYLGELYKTTKSLDILKDIYYCLKLNGTVEKIYEFEENISEDTLAEWEFDIVSNIIHVRKGDEMKQREEMFLMGSNHIKQSARDLIKIWKEKYRYIG